MQFKNITYLQQLGEAIPGNQGWRNMKNKVSLEEK